MTTGNNGRNSQNLDFWQDDGFAKKKLVSWKKLHYKVAWKSKFYHKPYFLDHYVVFDLKKIYIKGREKILSWSV